MHQLAREICPRCAAFETLYEPKYPKSTRCTPNVFTHDNGKSLCAASDLFWFADDHSIPLTVRELSDKKE